MRLAAAVMRRAWIILLTGAILGVLGGTLGYFKFHSSYKATAQFIRQESTATFRASELGEPFKPRQLSVQTLVSLIKSPVVMQRVAEKTQLSARTILSTLTVTPERNTDLIAVTYVSGRSADAAAAVLNTFGNEVVSLIREMQVQEATEMNRLLKRQLTKTEDDLRAANQEELDFAHQAGLINADKEMDAYLRTLGDLDLKSSTMKIEFETVDLRIAALERELMTNNPLSEKVQIARERLVDLQQEYTDANPIITEQKAQLAELERRLQASMTNPISPPRQGEGGLSGGFYSELLNLRTQKAVLAVQIEKMTGTRASVEEKLRTLPEKAMQLVRIKARQQSLEGARSLLASRQREAQLYEENSPAYYRYFETTAADVERSGRSQKIILLGIVGGIFGAGGALLVITLLELLDDHIKTAADLKRVTRLPLLARLPDLERLDAVAQAHWAFRTWLVLESRLTSGASGNRAIGFVSSSNGEGRSTWIELLARAAAQRHPAVLVVTNRPPANSQVLPLERALESPGLALPESGRTLWLSFPAGWIWTAKYRQQWFLLQTNWNLKPQTTIFVEICQADDPDNLMLAESLPQLIWLADGGKARGRSSRDLLVTLQNAGCRFGGSVLNREARLFPWS